MPVRRGGREERENVGSVGGQEVANARQTQNDSKIEMGFVDRRRTPTVCQHRRKQKTVPPGALRANLIANFVANFVGMAQIR